eukprot:gnl/TRDRNA2_/TRDRNA2_43216_c0_seq1.p1 gnl/TRDRNA2_/TRDRNA2_43216_c0~~gnl/TRDRNA2_/TRDRNA2_43216_c0_seq1.p1  ORF type:complete len:411 (+),score=70.85 gnl/TRDRNA2_/TRDRNA2_43216_c0_seq1:1-1233(+)
MRWLVSNPALSWEEAPMDVLYDARGKDKDSGAASVPPLSEWLVSYPRLAESLHACSLRFIINLPEESLTSAARLCFELQEAFWFYLDYLYEKDKRELPKLNQMNFVHLMLESSEILRTIYRTPQQRKQLVEDWREYCRKVPLKGAILLNERLDKCLMVQPWKGDKWMYPRGKINEDESEAECAVREVWEETGIDIAGKVDVGAFVKAEAQGSNPAVKLFLVPGIPEEVPCAPNTRKEISKIGWIQLCRLPMWGPDAEESSLRFFCVDPFVSGIRKWVDERKAKKRVEERNGHLQAAVDRNGHSVTARNGAPHHHSGPGPPFPPFAHPAEASMIPSTAPDGPPPGLEAIRSSSEAAGADVREARQEVGRNSQHLERSVNGYSGGRHQSNRLFSLDLAKVMKAFDRGWDRAR